MADSELVVPELRLTPGVGQVVAEWGAAVDPTEGSGHKGLQVKGYELWTYFAPIADLDDVTTTAFKVADYAGTTGFIPSVVPGSPRYAWVRPFDHYGNFGPFTTTVDGLPTTASLPANPSALSDITPDIGETTAGTITGALIRTSESGSRIELRSDTVRVRWLDDSTERISIGLNKDSGSSVTDAPIYMRVADPGVINGAVFWNEYGVGCFGRSDAAYPAVLGEAWGSSGRGGAFYQQSSSSAGGINLAESVADGGWAARAIKGNGMKAPQFVPFTGAHEALLRKEAEARAGDIMVDLRVLSRNGVNDTITEVVLSSSEGQRGVIGVFSSRRELHDLPQLTALPAPRYPGEVSWLYRWMKRHFDYLLVNSVGEGQINVCGRGGDIALGDFICASDLAGKGQRQNDADGEPDDLVRRHTVAKARESVTFDYPDQVKRVACVYLCG